MRRYMACPGTGLVAKEKKARRFRFNSKGEIVKIRGKCHKCGKIRTEGAWKWDHDTVNGILLCPKCARARTCFLSGRHEKQGIINAMNMPQFMRKRDVPRVREEGCTDLIKGR